jgi:hypothetical protein
MYCCPMNPAKRGLTELAIIGKTKGLKWVKDIKGENPK